MKIKESRVNRLYSLNQATVNRLEILHKLTGANRSRLVRIAIDQLFAAGIEDAPGLRAKIENGDMEGHLDFEVDVPEGQEA